MENNIIHPNSTMEQREHNMTEEPLLIIEHVDDSADRVVGVGPVTVRSRGRWVWIPVAIVAAALIVAASVWGYWYYRRYVSLGVSVSHTARQDVERLRMQTLEEVAPEVVVSHDSILGVAFDLYELRGLRGEVTMVEPDTADVSVIFYSRCADYGKDGTPIGSLVSSGTTLSDDDNRLGYCGMVGGRTVIGVSRHEDVRDFCVEAGGSFFRQFILVSNGELPPRFHLHGKVERRALGLMADGRLCYVQSCAPEVMTAFADALREYGFVDAIYITGGTDYCYYRLLGADGSTWERHDLGDAALYPHRKSKGRVPWMVFRAR